MILQEIVGEYSSNISLDTINTTADKDGFFYLEGHMLIKDINRKLQLNLPTNGPKTLNGLILESIQIIPKHNLCLKINNYIIETLKTDASKINSLRIKELKTAETSQMQSNDYTQK